MTPVPAAMLLRSSPSGTQSLRCTTAMRSHSFSMASPITLSRSSRLPGYRRLTGSKMILRLGLWIASRTFTALSGLYTMCFHTGSIAIVTPHFSALSTTGASPRMKVSSASSECVLASILYWAFGAPVSVPTTPAPRREATRRCP